MTPVIQYLSVNHENAEAKQEALKYIEAVKNKDGISGVVNAFSSAHEDLNQSLEDAKKYSTVDYELLRLQRLSLQYYNFTHDVFKNEERKTTVAKMSIDRAFQFRLDADQAVEEFKRPKIVKKIRSLLRRHAI